MCVIDAQRHAKAAELKDSDCSADSGHVNTFHITWESRSLFAPSLVQRPGFESNIRPFAAGSPVLSAPHCYAVE